MKSFIAVIGSLSLYLNLSAQTPRETADFQISTAFAPYRQFANGEVYHVGKFIYAHYGVVPKPEANPAGKGVIRILIGFKVLDVLPGGARIEPRNAVSRGTNADIFVTGLQDYVYEGRVYDKALMILSAGQAYEFKPAKGATRVIPRVEFGRAITKEQYLAKTSKPTESPAEEKL